MNKLGTTMPSSPNRKIGIALGSGVARGWAHIGVLKVLQREGIEPDVISGTSIGALVGAAYAANRLSEIEDFARSLTRTRMFNLMDVKFGGSGIFSGNKLARKLEDRFGDLQIENLDKTFVAVASELYGGHEVWMREGPLVNAVRASYALPGIFEPREIDGRWLIDGALVNPVPVSVCRALGARTIIGVGLNTDAFSLSAVARGHRVEALPTPAHLPHTPPPLPEEPTKQNLIDEGLSGAPKRAPATEKNEEETDEEAGENSSWAFMQQLFTRSDKGRLVKEGSGKESLIKGSKTKTGREREAPGLTDVLVGALDISQDRLARARLASDPADVLIAPNIADFGPLDFDKADELIEIGEAATEHALPYIHRAIENMY
ncbi:MAG: NTE family protein [Parvibaculaceae bacterium]|jgi:NTE family protein